MFKRISALLEPGTTQESAQALVKEVVQRVGRGAAADFARVLCNRVTCRLLPSDHCEAVLEMLTSKGTDEEPGQALLALITDAANANPYIFVPLSHQVGLPLCATLSSLTFRCQAMKKNLAARMYSLQADM